MKPSKWITLRDWGCDEWLECRHVGNRTYQFIQITDMNAACGRDNAGRDKFVAELSLVDLNAVGPAAIADARRSCGWDGMPADDGAIAECLFQYGNRAPLYSISGNNWRKLWRGARSEAKSLLDDSMLADAMDRPVNAIGSTAAEYMRGDLNAACHRGVYAGDPAARIMAKMSGVDPHVIDDARPADWLPYFVGYTDATTGRPRLESDPNDPVSPEYFQGFDRGVNVKAGKAPAPSWIKT